MYLTDLRALPIRLILSHNIGLSLMTQTLLLLPMNRLLAGRAIRPLTEDHTAVLQEISTLEISTLATGIRGIEPHSILTGRARPGVRGITM